MKNLLFVMLLGLGVVRVFGAPVSVQVKVLDDLGAPVVGADAQAKGVGALFVDFACRRENGG